MSGPLGLGLLPDLGLLKGQHEDHEAARVELEREVRRFSDALKDSPSHILRTLVVNVHFSLPEGERQAHEAQFRRTEQVAREIDEAVSTIRYKLGFIGIG